MTEEDAEILEEDSNIGFRQQQKQERYTALLNDWITKFPADLSGVKPIIQNARALNNSYSQPESLQRLGIDLDFSHQKDCTVSSDPAHDSDQDILQALELNPSDYNDVLTVIGGSLFSYQEWNQILPEILSIAISKYAAESLQSSAKNSKGNKLAVVSAGVSSGIMRAPGKSRIWMSEELLDRYTVLGIVPKELTRNKFQRDKKISPIVEDTYGASKYPTHMVYLHETDPRTSLKKYAEEQWNDTSTMVVRLSSALGEHANKVTLVVGGGEGTFIEVVSKLRQRERMVVLCDVGRVSDALAGFLGYTSLSEKEKEYMERIKAEVSAEDLDFFKAHSVAYSPFQSSNVEEVTSAISARLISGNKAS